MSKWLNKCLSDEMLMRAYARGDQDAFTQLYERHKLNLYHFVLRQTCLLYTSPSPRDRG